jgi:opacity protein-like surface antigen
MHASIRAIVITLICFVLSASHLSAQLPMPAARGRTLDTSLGYSYLSRSDSYSNRVGLSGADASLTIAAYPRLAVRVDLGYARASNIGGSARHSDVLSYLAGPVFYPIAHGHVMTYVHGLAGAARVTGPILRNSGGYVDGAWVNKFAWAVGGGVEYWVSDSVAVRAGTDYLRTSYFESSSVIAGQNNVRTTIALVYFFGKHSRTGR